MEKIDCAMDYRDAFGEDAPKPSFIAISGDRRDEEHRGGQHRRTHIPR